MITQNRNAAAHGGSAAQLRRAALRTIHAVGLRNETVTLLFFVQTHHPELSNAPKVLVFTKYPAIAATCMWCQ